MPAQASSGDWPASTTGLTLSCVGPGDVVKVIDQGDDSSFNAAAMRELIGASSGARTTTSTADATLIQSFAVRPHLAA